MARRLECQRPWVTTVLVTRLTPHEVAYLPKLMPTTSGRNVVADPSVLTLV